MKRRVYIGSAMAAILAIAVAAALVVPQLTHAAPPASNPPGGALWKAFGDGAWAPHAGKNSQFGFVTTSDSTGTFGGLDMKRLPTTDPAAITALSFDFSANMSGASGGSPRLVVEFSDGGNGELRPLTWTANTWATVDGMSGNNWDNEGGTCGFQYATTWSAIVACHAGATIADIFVVNDSGWLYSQGEQVTLDNVVVNDTVAAGPGNSH